MARSIPAIIYLVVFSYTFFISLLGVNGELLYARQANVCANIATDVYCSPAAGELWDVGTYRRIIWNNLNPALAPATSVDIYLIYLDGGSNTVTKSWTDAINNGTLDIFVAKDWFPADKQLVADTIKEFALHIAWSGQQREKFPRGPSFRVRNPAQLAPTMIVTTMVKVPMTTYVDTPTSTYLKLTPAGGNEGSFPTWAIGVISALGTCALIAIVAGVFVWQLRKRRPKDSHFFSPSHTSQASAVPMAATGNTAEKTAAKEGALETTNKEGASISSFPSNRPTSSLSGNGGNGLRASIGSAGATSENEAGSRRSGHSNVLSATDAMLIADAFRQQMRKPTWEENGESGAGDESEKERSHGEDKEKNPSGDKS
ncbi:uncharacterized protein VTP21DRAFT_10443 [Calcarisporiella thermophila]|uniref:uncharacterized protein n=1 Tax=Calcarisporiella thermophila TaxID=911321 RepID=UPI003743B103